MIQISFLRFCSQSSYALLCVLMHVCIDDHSRLSFTQIHPDEKAVSAITHLRAAVAWFVSMESGSSG